MPSNKSKTVIFTVHVGSCCLARHTSILLRVTWVLINYKSLHRRQLYNEDRTSEMLSAPKSLMSSILDSILTWIKDTKYAVTKKPICKLYYFSFDGTRVTASAYFKCLCYSRLNTCWTSLCTGRAEMKWYQLFLLTLDRTTKKPKSS